MDESSSRTLAANPDLWLGPIARGAYHLARIDLSAAERYMRRAAQLDRGDDPQLRTYLANFGMQLGRVQEAASIRRSNETIDPIYRNDPWKVWDLVMLGRYQDSIDLYARLSRIDQGSLQSFNFQTHFAYLLLGAEAEASEFAEQHDIDENARDAYKALLTMSETELSQSLREQGAIQIGSTALYAAHDGEPEFAVALMRRAFEKPSGFVLFLLWHPAMAEARKTDAFEQLVIDLGFVKAWRESGDWGDFCRPVSQTEISCK
jgi:tetratricopeptide (TPR) repeat protein